MKKLLYGCLLSIAFLFCRLFTRKHNAGNLPTGAKLKRTESNCGRIWIPVHANLV